MKKTEVFVLTFVFNMVLFGLYFAHTFLEYYEGVYAREDGLIEWMTVGALLLGCGLALYRWLKLRERRPKLFLSCLLILAALCFFGAGEEISWGQRMFDLKRPDFFMKHNAQEELNLHNLVVGGVKINKLIFGTFLGVVIACYLLLLPVLYRYFHPVKSLTDTLAIPVPRLVHFFSYLLLFLLVWINPSPKRGELLEFGGCFLFLLINLFPYNEKIYQKESYFPA